MKKWHKNRVVCFGEALWDIFPEGKRPGGAPMNVSYHLGKLGIPGWIVTRVGTDELGVELRQRMTDLGLSVEYCQDDNHHPTGTVMAHMDSMYEARYEIVRDVAWDFIEWNDRLNQIVEDSSVLVFGSLAMRNSVSYETLKKLISVSAFRVFDVNFRSPFIDKTKVLDAFGSTELLKLNADELKMIAKWQGMANDTEERKVNHIRETFSIQEVLVTKGDKGATYYHDDQIYQYKAPVVKVADTIGSGDAFLAGFLASKIKNRSSIDTQLQAAGTLAAFVTTQKGACPSYSVNELLTNVPDNKM